MAALQQRLASSGTVGDVKSVFSWSRQPRRRGAVVRFQTEEHAAAREVPPPRRRNAAVLPGQLDGCLVLRRAEQDIREWCEDGHADSCDVLDWYVHKVQDAEAGLALGGTLGEADARLAQALREVAASGCGLESMVRSLSLMKRLEEQRAKGFRASAPSPAQAWPQHGPPGGIPVTCGLLGSRAAPAMLSGEQREVLTQLFAKADANGDGHLSWSEFHRALAWIENELTEEQQEVVSSALDLDGSVTLEQFLAIVEAAEEERAAGLGDARFLRHLTHTHPDGSGHHVMDRMMM